MFVAYVRAMGKAAGGPNDFCGPMAKPHRMFALTAQFVYGTYGELWLRPDIWAPEKLGYRVYDVTDKGAPVLEADVSMDGVFVESRRIGNVVYIISRYSPNLPGLVYAPTKIAYVMSGLALCSASWMWTWGDSGVAGEIYRATLAGDYVITPDHLIGREDIEFSGN